jgi:3-carboxy-cis,cis-muconate cycloisomerase
MADFGLLEPGAHRVTHLVDDDAVAAAMVAVEVAWVRAVSAGGGLPEALVSIVSATAAGWRPDVAELAAAAEAGGTPVLPLVGQLRKVVAERDGTAAEAVHRGLTSQDVLDTALMLVARDVLEAVDADLSRSARALGRLAEDHRDTILVGRTLTQHAVPITFGLKAARWLEGVLDAAERVASVQAALPAQCGGAAGTLSLAAELVADPLRAAQRFADELGLIWPGAPWHTQRGPVTRLGDALVGVTDALGLIAADVALMARPELGEVREPGGEGRGASSTMPHKRNPVLSVLVKAAALQAPLLGAQLHLAAAQAVDERPDGAWHAEWPALGRLLGLAATASAQAAEVLEGLEVDSEAMRRRVEAVAEDLVTERPQDGQAVVSPHEYLGAAGTFVDHAIARLNAWEASRG